LGEVAVSVVCSEGGFELGEDRLRRRARAIGFLKADADWGDYHAFLGLNIEDNGRNKGRIAGEEAEMVRWRAELVDGGGGQFGTGGNGNFVGLEDAMKPGSDKGKFAEHRANVLAKVARGHVADIGQWKTLEFWAESEDNDRTSGHSCFWQVQKLSSLLTKQARGLLAILTEFAIWQLATGNQNSYFMI
jgi:hypothetical protein